MTFYVVNKDGLQPDSGKDAFERIKNGEIMLYRGGVQELGFFDDIRNTLLEYVEANIGAEKAAELDRRGIEKIHEYVSGEQVLDIYTKMRKMLVECMPFYVKRITSEFLGLSEFYIHRNSLIRMFVPHEMLQNNIKDFSKHLGKLDLHGPHHDFYQNVTLNAVNLWIAIGRVKAENGLSLYTDVWGKTLPRGTDHVANDQYLGRPVNLECEPGDIVFFHSHHMHSSVLNSSDETRIVLTNRFTPEKPLHPNGDAMTRYYYSEKITAIGDYEEASYRNTIDDVIEPPEMLSHTKMDAHNWQTKNPDELQDNEITAIDEKRCAVKVDGKTHYIARRCPHIGADLSLGYVKDGKIFCPWHNLAFDPETGKSACSAIKPLKLYP